MLLHLGVNELVVNPCKTGQMSGDAPTRIFRTGPRAEDERPITGLSQQKFTAGLFEGAEFKFVWVREAVRQLGHALLGNVEMWINPLVLFIKPDAPVPIFSPA